MIFNKQFFTLIGFVFFLIGSDIFDREPEVVSDFPEEEIAIGQKTGQEYRIRRASVGRKAKG